MSVCVCVNDDNRTPYELAFRLMRCCSNHLVCVCVVPRSHVLELGLISVNNINISCGTLDPSHPPGGRAHVRVQFSSESMCARPITHTCMQKTHIQAAAAAAGADATIKLFYDATARSVRSALSRLGFLFGVCVCWRVGRAHIVEQQHGGTEDP